MKKLVLSLCCTLAMAGCATTESQPTAAGQATVAAPQGASNFTLPEYQKVQLNNGLTLLLMEQHEVPLIDMQIIVRGGALKDGDQPGLAAMTANALMFGTQSLDKASFEDQLDFIGARVDSDAGKEFNQLSASFAAKDSELMLSLMKELLLTPNFDAKEFAKYKQRYQLRLKQQKESPKAVIDNYFGKLLFGQHPYATVVEGNSASVAAIKLDDVKAFHQAIYQPQQTTISLAGDFDSAAMKARLTRLFDNWQGDSKQGSSLALTTPASPAKAKVLLVNKDDARETTFYIGGLGVPRNHSDYVAIQVVNTVLGGRFTSWLNDELRVNSGLTYGARSRFVRYSQGGLFRISTFTQTDKTEEAIDLALKTYDRLWQQGLDAATLASAKAYVKGQFPPRYETSSQLASLLGQMNVYGFDERFINEFERQVDALTPAKVQQVINDYFPRENLQFVLVGKADDIRQVAAKYGQVIETDIKKTGFTF